ncbi:MAG: YbjN domain-containing protein [Actinobacteria bacterium]|nr:YbjN domain-containing protein [Actinomycetota bacterium]
MTNGTSTAAAWVEAAREWLTAQNLPVRDGDSRVLTAIPLNDDRSKLLRMSLGATEQTNGLVARAHTGVEVSRENWQRALWLCNRWNRDQPSPRATFLVQDWENDTAGAFILDAWLPGGDEPSASQVDRFVDTFVRGAAGFSRDAKVQALGAS